MVGSDFELHSARTISSSPLKSASPICAAIVDLDAVLRENASPLKKMVEFDYQLFFVCSMDCLFLSSFLCE